MDLWNSHGIKKIMLGEWRGGGGSLNFLRIKCFLFRYGTNIILISDLRLESNNIEKLPMNQN